MNINEFKKHLQSVHNTLDDPSHNNQLRDRLNRMNEGPVDKMVEYKPDPKIDKSTDAPTTAAGDSLRPKSKIAEPLKKLKEEIEIPECVQQYFENYFGEELNEDTSDDDIADAVNNLIYLCEAVCDAVGLKKNLTVDEAKIIKPKDFVMPSMSGSATIERGSGSNKGIPTTFVPKKYAASTTPIRTLKPSKKGSLELTQSGKRAKDEPLVRLGQGSYEKVIRPSDLR